MSDETDMVIPRGFRAGAVKAGIKPSGGLDLALLVADGDCASAGTFTTNRVCAAPVRWCREHLPSDRIRAVVINAGNANAATGQQGFANAARTAQVAAYLLACRPEQVLVASTGVIGRQLPMEQLEDGLARVSGELSSHAAAFELATQAMMTTDTFSKVVSFSDRNDDSAFAILGLAKGAAMIGPRMATMLAFLLTEAPVRPRDLQLILSGAVDESFNCLSVEGHMSTNDTVLVLSNPPAGSSFLAGRELSVFAETLRSACQSLAQMIAWDGEGATHFITIDVEGCGDREEARAIARAVADSPLVKTAIHGADPNWGRIVSAAGYAGVPFEEHELSLWINDVQVYREGVPTAFDAVQLSNQLRSNRDVSLRLTMTRGDSKVRFWTCDLTAEYVRLNADYTT